MQSACNCIDALKENLEGKDFDTVFAIMLVDKLDADTSRAWERHRATLAASWASQDDSGKREASMHLPSWDDLKAFLQSEIEIFAKSEMRARLQNSVGCTPQPSSSDVIVQDNLHTNAVRSQQVMSEEKKRAPEYQQCTLCDGIHARYKCDVYIAMGFARKWKHVYEEGLCQRCMHANHGHTSCANKRNNDNCPTCYNADDRRVVVYHNSTLCPVKYGLAAGIEPAYVESWDN